MQRDAYDPFTYTVPGDVPDDKAVRLAVARSWFPNGNFGRGVTTYHLFALAAEKRAAAPAAAAQRQGVPAAAAVPPAAAAAVPGNEPAVGLPGPLPGAAVVPANIPARGPPVAIDRGSDAWRSAFATVWRDTGDAAQAMALADAAAGAVAAAGPAAQPPVPIETVAAEAARAFPKLVSLSGVASVAEALRRAIDAARRALGRVLTTQRAGNGVSPDDALDLQQREDELATLVRTTANNLSGDHGGRVLYEVKCSAPRLHAAVERYTAVMEEQRILARTHAASGGSSGSGSGNGAKSGNNGRRRGRGRNEDGVVRCFSCDEVGHMSPDCPNASDSGAPANGPSWRAALRSA